MRTTAVVVLLSVLAAAACARQQPAQVNPDAQVLAEFNTRVDQYVQMRGKADNGAAALEKTNDGGDIGVAQDDLAQRIRTQRGTARQGDIFTPPVARHIRRLLRPEVTDRDTAASIRDDNPGAVPFKVNGPYPVGEPLSTVPPNVLAALPKLPMDLEYRFVGKHLILRDARADIVVDYLPNVLA